MPQQHKHTAALPQHPTTCKQEVTSAASSFDFLFGSPPITLLLLLSSFTPDRRVSEEFIRTEAGGVACEEVGLVMSHCAAQSEQVLQGSWTGCHLKLLVSSILTHEPDVLRSRGSAELFIQIISSHFFLPPELGDTEDHMHHAGGAGHGAGDDERRAAGEGAAVGGLEVHTGGREEPGGEEEQGGPKAAGLREAEQVSQLCWLRLSSSAQNISATELLPTHPQQFWQILQSFSEGILGNMRIFSELV